MAREGRLGSRAALDASHPGTLSNPARLSVCLHFPLKWK